MISLYAAYAYTAKSMGNCKVSNASKAITKDISSNIFIPPICQFSLPISTLLQSSKVFELSNNVELPPTNIDKKWSLTPQAR